MDRVTPNLSNNAGGPAFGALNAPSFIQASARKMNLPASDPNAAVLKMSKQARFELGEADNRSARSCFWIQRRRSCRTISCR